MPLIEVSVTGIATIALSASLAAHGCRCARPRFCWGAQGDVVTAG
jgi:hypothetical protein